MVLTNAATNTLSYRSHGKLVDNLAHARTPANKTDQARNMMVAVNNHFDPSECESIVVDMIMTNGQVDCGDRDV